MSTIEERYQEVYTRFVNTCEKMGKKPGEDVILVAVSKFFPVEDAISVYNCGQRDFGENRAQEMVEKAPVMAPDTRWHFIGRLQRNKVKSIINKTCMIHSCDSIDLAKEISKQAVNNNVIMPVLLEVNLAKQESKAGFDKDEVKNALEVISKMDGIKIMGLMTIGPYEANPDDSRPLFKGMKKLWDDAASWNIPGVTMKYLSMGMSHDFEAAIEEGANIVRVGSSIFGQRIYN